MSFYFQFTWDYVILSSRCWRLGSLENRGPSLRTDSWCLCRHEIDDVPPRRKHLSLPQTIKSWWRKQSLSRRCFLIEFVFMSEAFTRKSKSFDFGFLYILVYKLRSQGMTKDDENVKIFLTRWTSCNDKPCVRSLGATTTTKANLYAILSLSSSNSPKTTSRHWG